VFLEFVSDSSQDSTPDLSRVVRDLRLELAGVLVNSLYRGRVKLQSEIVAEQFELLALRLRVSCRSLRECLN
jgi:hypothetical protein